MFPLVSLGLIVAAAIAWWVTSTRNTNEAGATVTDHVRYAVEYRNNQVFLVVTNQGRAHVLLHSVPRVELRIKGAVVAVSHAGIITQGYQSDVRGKGSFTVDVGSYAYLVFTGLRSGGSR
jgi:hypothetical protein